jgi:di/tricarboxylate transporter
MCKKMNVTMPKMKRIIFSILFLVFLSLFAWEGPKTLRLIYGNDKGNAMGSSIEFWAIIGVLAAVFSGILTWYATCKSKR